jgi:hypothetical protein
MTIITANIYGKLAKVANSYGKTAKNVIGREMRVENMLRKQIP